VGADEKEPECLNPKAVTQHPTPRPATMGQLPGPGFRVAPADPAWPTRKRLGRCGFGRSQSSSRSPYWGRWPPFTRRNLEPDDKPATFPHRRGERGAGPTGAQVVKGLQSGFDHDAYDVRVLSHDDAKHQLDTAQIYGVAVIPPNFSSKLQAYAKSAVTPGSRRAARHHRLDESASRHPGGQHRRPDAHSCHHNDGSPGGPTAFAR
jgi:hypothetical protein